MQLSLKTQLKAFLKKKRYVQQRKTKFRIFRQQIEFSSLFQKQIYMDKSEHENSQQKIEMIQSSGK